MPEPYPALTPEQSAARIRELREQGYDVQVETLPDGTQVVSKSRPVDWGLVVAMCFGLGCLLASVRRG